MKGEHIFTHPSELPGYTEHSVARGTGIGESSALHIPEVVPDGDSAILQHQVWSCHGTP